ALGLALTLLAFVPATAQALYSPQASVVSANPADNTPNVLDGMVRAIVPLGNRIIVGGTFSQVQAVGAGQPVLTRHGLFSFDPVTGAVDPGFTPGLDVDPTSGREVEALAPSPDGRSVFVAGSFGQLNGAAVDKVLKLDGTSGAPDPAFHLTVRSAVKDIAVAGTELYLAGDFTSVDNPDGRTLVAGGNFRTAGGQSRVQIAMVDLGARPAQVANWQTDSFNVQC